MSQNNYGGGVIENKNKTPERWEAKLDGEPTGAFNAFCLFKAMGHRRSIKGCMELHGVEARKYPTWSRWARLYDWNERAAEYDAYVSKEVERELVAERVQRKKRQIDILNEFDGLVERRLKTLKPEDLNADGAMDILERSAKLDGFLFDKEELEKCGGENGGVQVVFANEFNGL